ncbi:hypothetical protein [Ructibacterium gallinarum]|uniref:Uncharacterized protein n=1 Tax=Ructibacterium gallinarum TaxID=2779355 RepID=A0A9D5M718_9FIRM|nr:hypothetical protein [Ructibacterium gallinarum]MBE5040697.1 hypothetical protein [Ructibacterium gallinarum]
MENNVPKMRLIREVYDELHKIDPNSAITMYALRQLVKTKKIPSVNVGRKVLVNYYDVVKYFETPTPITMPYEEFEGIRCII